MTDQRQVDLLRSLIAANGEPVRLETLAELDGITVDLSSILSSLEPDGFTFDRTTTAVRLVSEPDAIRAQSVLARLETELIGREIYVFRETGSTNDLAKMAGLGGAKEGVTFFAERQSDGRGTQGRSWVSEANQGLWFSVLLRSQLPVDEWPVLVRMAALAAADAAESWLDRPVSIKPPNDLILAGGKLAGFLLETSNAWDFQVLGIGINVRSAPKIEGYPTAALEQFSSGRPVLLAALAARILNQFEALYQRTPLDVVEKGFARKRELEASRESRRSG
jgi:BirA family transcriptional regulator, biotin operon repressor / biotin---[acetyl-CoA-carboxylase] ligase